MNLERNIFPFNPRPQSAKIYIYVIDYFQLPPVRAVLGGLSRASKENEPGSFANWGADEQSDHGKDIEQFGQLIATLLGHCHGSSEYIQVRFLIKGSIRSRWSVYEPTILFSLLWMERRSHSRGSEDLVTNEIRGRKMEGGRGRVCGKF